MNTHDTATSAIGFPPKTFTPDEWEIDAANIRRTQEKKRIQGTVGKLTRREIKEIGITGYVIKQDGRIFTTLAKVQQDPNYFEL